MYWICVGWRLAGWDVTAFSTEGVAAVWLVDLIWTKLVYIVVGVGWGCDWWFWGGAMFLNVVMNPPETWFVWMVDTLVDKALETATGLPRFWGFKMAYWEAGMFCSTNVLIPFTPLFEPDWMGWMFGTPALSVVVAAICACCVETMGFEAMGTGVVIGLPIVEKVDITILFCTTFVAIVWFGAISCTLLEVTGFDWYWEGGVTAGWMGTCWELFLCLDFVAFPITCPLPFCFPIMVSVVVDTISCWSCVVIVMLCIFMLPILTGGCWHSLGVLSCLGCDPSNTLPVEAILEWAVFARNTAPKLQTNILTPWYFWQPFKVSFCFTNFCFNLQKKIPC